MRSALAGILLACSVMLALTAGAAQSPPDWEGLTDQVYALSRQGQYGQAIIVAQKALAAAEESFGLKHPAVAITLNNLAGLYRAQGRTWTDKFNEKFTTRHGFDPRPYYPALWYDIGPDTQAARNFLFGFRTELYATGFFDLVGGAGAMLLSRNVVHAAFWLLEVMVAVAGLFLLLSAEFLALVQLMVYAGAVSVLVLFTVMLTLRRREDAVRPLGLSWAAGGLALAF